jgi:hypothetical protein
LKGAKKMISIILKHDCGEEIQFSDDERSYIGQGTEFETICICGKVVYVEIISGEK